MNQYGNLFTEQAQLFQVTAHVSYHANGWWSSRQVETVMIIAENPADAGLRVARVAHPGHETVERVMLSAGVIEWASGNGFDVRITADEVTVTPWPESDWRG